MIYMIQDIQKLLLQTWLNKKEASIYISCLQFWHVSASTLARNTWIPRPSIYDITSRLIKKWFLTQGKTKGKSKFIAVEPRNIYVMLNEKKNIIEQQVESFWNALEQFETLKQFTWILPQIQYYEWKESLEYFFQQIADADYSYSIFSLDDLLKHIYHDIDQIMKKLSHSWVKWAKRIMSYSESAMKYIEQQKNPNIQWKILPKWYDIPAEITLYDWVLLQMSFGDTPSILEMKHPIYFKAHKTLFDYIWNSL